MKYGKNIVDPVISMIALSSLFTIVDLFMIIYQQMIKNRELRSDEFLISVENMIRADIFKQLI
ncbi:hypothetical protein HZS_6723 [Henneguya salminicola]|nr:hypothetical protein HZS_6723 [Henneguya salminicola]